MNKRILELAEEAGFYITEGKILIPTISEDITTAQLKFTELLVKDCVSVLREASFEAERTYRYMGDDVPTVAHECNIKQHFGVK